MVFIEAKPPKKQEEGHSVFGCGGAPVKAVKGYWKMCHERSFEASVWCSADWPNPWK